MRGLELLSVENMRSFGRRPGGQIVSELSVERVQQYVAVAGGVQDVSGHFSPDVS